VVSLQVTASDAAYSSVPGGNPPQYLQLELSPSGADSDAVTGSLLIAVKDLLESKLSPNNHGDRHTIYVQAIDSDGYSGPVTAVWLDTTDVGEGGGVPSERSILTSSSPLTATVTRLVGHSSIRRVNLCSLEAPTTKTTTPTMSDNVSTIFALLAIIIYYGMQGGSL